jgi:hypothetical protein
MIGCILFHFKCLRYACFLSIRDTSAFIIDFFANCYVCNEYFVTFLPSSKRGHNAFWAMIDPLTMWPKVIAGRVDWDAADCTFAFYQDHFTGMAYQIIDQ